MRPFTPGDRRGITMIEIMVGTVILVLALLPLFGLSIQHTRGVGISIDEIDATSYATGLMESLQIVPMELLVPRDQPEGVPLADLPQELRDHLRAPEDPENRFPLSVNILAVSSEPGTDLASLPASPRARFEDALEMRVLEVYCNFLTRGLEGSSGRTRARQIKLVTLVSRGARRF